MGHLITSCLHVTPHKLSLLLKQHAAGWEVPDHEDAGTRQASAQAAEEMNEPS